MCVQHDPPFPIMALPNDSRPPPDDLEGHYVPNTSILLGRRVGLGGFGAVYLAHKTDDKRHQFAVKVLPKPVSATQKKRKEREIRLHTRVSHLRGVVTLRDVFYSEDGLTYMVMDYCKRGDLLQYINNTPLAGKKVVRRKLDLFLEILDAVMSCHALGVYHRDLKPENILLQSESRGARVCLADFGLSTDAEIAEDVQTGTTEYMSPACLADEATSGRYKSAPNDVWGLGVLLYALMFAMRPWQRAAPGSRHYDAFLLSPRPEHYFLHIRNISKEANDLFVRCFDIDPDKRCAMAEFKDCITRLRDSDRFFVSPEEGDTLRLWHERGNPLSEEEKEDVLQKYRQLATSNEFTFQSAIPISFPAPPPPPAPIETSPFFNPHLEETPCISPHQSLLDTSRFTPDLISGAPTPFDSSPVHGQTFHAPHSPASSMSQYSDEDADMPPTPDLQPVRHLDGMEGVVPDISGVYAHKGTSHKGKGGGGGLNSRSRHAREIIKNMFSRRLLS